MNRGASVLLSALVALTLGPSAGAELLEVPAWRAHFDSAGVTGAILLYEPDTDRYRTSDRRRAETAYRPASTFKIFTALAAIDAGAAAGPDEVFPWDGEDRCVAGWNRNLSLRTAYHASAFWLYQRFARQIGEKRMRNWLRQARYGNQDLGGGIDRFWLDGGLRTSLVDHVEFLRRLRGRTLPFTVTAVEAVLDVMVDDQGEGFVLRGKTGWARRLNAAGDRFADCPPAGRGDLGPSVDPEIGWYVGYIERGERVVFFALNLDIREAADASARREIVRRVLRDEGLLGASSP